MSKKTALLDINDDVYSTTSDFEAIQLALKSDGLWHFKLKIAAALPQTFREYNAALVLNEKPYLDAISSSKRDKQTVEDEADLFPKEKKSNIAKIDQEIKAKEEELAEAHTAHPDIPMTFNVESIAWKDDGVVVVAIIPAEVIAEINERRHEISQNFYQIKLTH